MNSATFPAPVAIGSVLNRYAMLRPRASAVGGKPGVASDPQSRTVWHFA